MTINCRSGSSGSSPSHSRDGATFDSSYVEYLRSARTSVQNCVNACQAWSAPYNGENPTVESFSDITRGTSTSHTAAKELVASQRTQDEIPASQNEVDIDEANGTIEAAAAESLTAVVTSSDKKCPPSSTVDDETSQAEVFPSAVASSAVSIASPESVTDNAVVSLDAVSTNAVSEQRLPCSESELVSSSSNQDAAQPTLPPGHSTTTSTADDLESFLRQLSHVSAKADSDAAAVDILTEFDEVISQLDTASEDLDSQKTITPEEQFTSDLTESFPSQIENDTSAVQSLDSTANAADSDGTDNMQSSDDTDQTKARDGETLASGNENDKSDKDADKADDDDLLHCSQSRPFSALLHCQFEPPYLPTTGMSTSTPV